MISNRIKTAFGVRLVFRIVAIGVVLAAHRGSADPPIPPKASGEEAARTDLYGDPLPDGALVRMGSVRLRHNNAAVAYSADGKTLISAGGVGDVRFWDAATGRELRRVELLGPRDGQASVRDPHLTPDGKRLALWEQGRTASAAVVYETATGKELFRFPTDGKGWCTFRFSHDGKTLASLALSADHKSRTICVWDLTTGKTLLERVLLGTIWGMALSPDGRSLVWSDDKNSTVCDTTSGKELGRLPATSSQYYFSPDGKVFAGHAWNSQGIHLWDMANFREIRVIDPTAESLNLLGFAANVVVAYSGPKNELALVDAAGEKKTVRIAGVRTQNVAISPDGKSLACADDSSIRVYDVATGGARLDFPGHRNGVWSASVSADGKVVASAAGWADGYVNLWDTATGKWLRSVPGHDSSVSGCELSRDGQFLVTGGFEGSLRLWNLASGKERSQLRFGEAASGLVNNGNCFQLTADGKHLMAVGTSDRSLDGQYSLCVLDTSTGELAVRRPFAVDYLARRNPDGGSMSRILFHSAFSPDGALITAWDKTQLQISDVLTGRVRATIAGEFVRPSAFSADNRLLAAGIRKAGVDPFEPEVEAVGLFESATGKEILRFETGVVYHLAFSPDGRFLATSDSQKKMRIWDVGTGKEVFSRNWPKGLVPHPTWTPVGSMAFLPDSKRLVTGMLDGTLLVWDMSRLTDDRTPATPLGREELARLWADLGGEDAKRAHRAQMWLAASPGESLPFLRERVRPDRPVDGKRVEALVADLADARFPVREAASKELAKLIDQIEPLLTRARDTNPSAEVRRRIAAVLAASYPALTAEQVQALRAIATLERIGTPAARDVLRGLADGGSGRESREARESLERLELQTAATVSKKRGD